MKHRLFCFLFTCAFVMAAQENITTQLYDTYENYKETSLTKRRIKHHQIQPLIQKFDANPKFDVQKVGESIEGRDLHLISIGTGEENIFLWSQMHGNEPTATQAIFDILNFLDAPEFAAEKQEILSKLKLHFLPMLNPDGAEVYQRRNALGIDINRDALRLQSPEGRTLKRIRDSLNADFGFNLHDQSTYYNAKLTDKPATISYLATAYNYEKDINEVRSKAMQVIVFMNDIIQNYAPGQVGRYSDDFEPRAFGDNIAKWGTSLILIESGGYANDEEKQEIRKLNYVSILSALYSIAKGNYKQIPIEEYEKIPRNDRKLFDLKIENVTYELLGKEYILDLGIHRQELDLEGHNEFYYRSAIVDQGDLSTYYGYETFDATGYTIVAPKIAPETLKTNSAKTWSEGENPWKSGYAYLKAQFLPPVPFLEFPMHMVSEDFQLDDLKLQPNINPTFFLRKDGNITHAVINGFLLDLNQPLEGQKFGNALIYR
ncbi:M14 family zinc carboxypeptidase [Flagellimonas allohymeniacidonis]|uniref:Peptidase M14 n=1 Tax=Flagellimonas allohymeniacidonis TaxID=2517819 RepID=A0A4Q8QEB8_9FLAO|nr:M14 family zinc carboxypeptidase [Allomuricauda hymeniacidonis]TAI48781.1 peptidase M14 [Allomuricauda hymeniacidonis]